MTILDTYNYYFVEQADERTNDWFLVGSPIPISIITFTYLYFVLKCGPSYMKGKKPYSLKGFIKFYNVFQISANSWIVYSLLEAGWFSKISAGCEPVDYSMDPMASKLANVMWRCYMLKVVDLMETGLFILRKKNKQISLLHLYHHVSTVFVGYTCTKYIAGGMATFPILLNCTVHVIMYTYYFLSSQGGTARKMMSFIKPYITIIQMVQFMILIMHAIQSFLPSCHVPRLPGIAMIANLLVNFVLFYDFYQKNYVKAKTS